MAKRPLVEFILHLINLVFTVCGLGILGYGLLCFFTWKQGSPKEIYEGNTKYMIVHHILLAVESPPKYSSDSLPKDWFIYLIIGIGAILLIVSFLGYIGTATRRPCCLFSYYMLLVTLILVELGTAVFAFFNHNWKEVIPEDRSDIYHTVYHFVNVNWNFIRYIAYGVFVLQVIAMIVAMYLRSVFNRARYDRSDHDDKLIVYLPRARTHNYNANATRDLTKDQRGLSLTKTDNPPHRKESKFESSTGEDFTFSVRCASNKITSE